MENEARQIQIKVAAVLVCTPILKQKQIESWDHRQRSPAAQTPPPPYQRRLGWRFMLITSRQAANDDGLISSTGRKTTGTFKPPPTTTTTASHYAATDWLKPEQQQAYHHTYLLGPPGSTTVASVHDNTGTHTGNIAGFVMRELKGGVKHLKSSCCFSRTTSWWRCCGLDAVVRWPDLEVFCMWRR